MAEENVVLLEVKTLDAVKSVNDLKENISALKHNLGLLEIGTEEYTETLNTLKTNQNLLKDAMYATSASLDDVKASATGASESYNSLVHRMAALKEEWRATNDEARRNEVGKQIADINQKLKDMDASVGNFQRTVGNYESGVSGLVEKFDQWGGILKQMPPTLGAAKESIGKVGESMQLVGKQPILGIIGLLAPIIIKITDALKDNETAMDAVKKVMASLQPVFDVLQGVLEKIAQGFAHAVEWLVDFVGQSDGIKNVVSSVMGVGNAVLQYLLAPIKSAVAAFKGLGKIIGDVFKGNWSEIKIHAKETGQEIAEAYKEGFSFKSNFQEGKVAGGKFIDGVADNKKKAKDTGKELAQAVKEGFDEWEDEQRALADEEAFNAEYQAQLDATEAFQKGLTQRMWDGIAARLDAQEQEKERLIQAEKEEREILKEIAEQKAKDKMNALFALAGTTSSVLGSIAGMYEADEEMSEKNAEKIKALRIAEATINTISGAIGAFMGITKDTGGWGIAAAAEAAAVMAAGMAQINQIRKTKVSSSGTSSTSNAIVSAPRVETNVPSVRSVTSATEEERLNQMAKDQRVYILSSDIEASLDDNKTRVEESSF